MDDSAAATATGMSFTPVWIGESPSTSCIHWASSSRAAIIAKVEPSAAMMPAVKALLRNRRSSSSGESLRRQRTVNQARIATAAAKAASAPGTAKDASLPNSLTDHTSSTMPTMDCTAAKTSQRPGLATVDSGSRK